MPKTVPSKSVGRRRAEEWSKGAKYDSSRGEMSTRVTGSLEEHAGLGPINPPNTQVWETQVKRSGPWVVRCHFLARGVPSGK